MAGLDVASVQDLILAKLETLPYQVEEGDVGDGYTIASTNGVTQTIVIVQFGDMLETGGDGSFGGPKHDGYYSIFRTLAIASSPSRARKAASVIGQLMLGWKPENGGAIGKEWGGGTFTIGEANSRPLAYSALSSFRFSTNVDGVGSTVYP